MADPTQFSFSLQEVGEQMLKIADIHDGKWSIGIEFGLTIGNIGLKPDEAAPGAMVVAQKFMLSRVSGPPDATPPNLILDAAKLNPRK